MSEQYGKAHVAKAEATRSLVVVLISAGTEWRAVRAMFSGANIRNSPSGEWFESTLPTGDRSVIFFHGGWGKVAAAASTQHAIDRFSPKLIINLGTCGGFGGEADNNGRLWAERAAAVMEKLMGVLPAWFDHVDKTPPKRSD